MRREVMAPKPRLLMLGSALLVHGEAQDDLLCLRHDAGGLTIYRRDIGTSLVAEVGLLIEGDAAYVQDGTLEEASEQGWPQELSEHAEQFPTKSKELSEHAEQFPTKSKGLSEHAERFPKKLKELSEHAGKFPTKSNEHSDDGGSYGDGDG